MRMHTTPGEMVAPRAHVSSIQGPWNTRLYLYELQYASLAASHCTVPFPAPKPKRLHASYRGWAANEAADGAVVALAACLRAPKTSLSALL
jgi:hypothetical protein